VRYAAAVASGFISVASVSGIRYSFGVLIPTIALDLGVSLAMITGAVTLHWMVFTVTAPLAWRLFARIGARAMIIAGGAASCMGMVLCSLIDTPWGVILSFGILVGTGTHGFGQMTAGAPLTGAPAATRDRSLGLIASGAPVGTAVYPAIAAIVAPTIGWRWTAVVLGAAVFSLTVVASGLLKGVPSLKAPDGGSPGSRTSTLWFNGTFLLLSAAFLITLGTQIAVPLLMPVWALELGVTPGQLAVAFVLLGVSGLAGRLALTSMTNVTRLRLWVTVPAAVLAVAGCAVAVSSAGVPGMYVATAFLGISTPVFGALFTIAALACFPPVLYARVTGSMLVPIGIGAALAPLLMSAVIDDDGSTTVVWIGIAVLITVASTLFLVAEVGSPVHRARIQA
jgi:predicted MFS family arabinose efflux permease